MSNTKHRSIASWVLIYLGILLFYFIAFKATSKNNNYPVQHFAAQEQVVHPDGSYTAGGPESYRVNISPAQNWDLTNHGGTRFARTSCLVIILGMGLFLFLLGTGRIQLESGGNYILVVLLGIAAAFMFASSSSALDQNYEVFSPGQFEAVTGQKADPNIKHVKDHDGNLHLLFQQKYDQKEFIK
jgi:hypothetical protein